jgi:N-sulfoglucosamine sulfohydrolase
MYYPMRGIRTRRYKYIRNLAHELPYPHASDLWASATWQSVLKQGRQGKIGKRSIVQYLHRPEEELYDITKDPDEVNNLAASQANKQVLEQLRTQVAEWRRKTKDPWVINDPYEEAERGI